MQGGLLLASYLRQNIGGGAGRQGRETIKSLKAGKWSTHALKDERREKKIRN